MARAESKMVMGYLPIEPHHHLAILSLVIPATPAVKLLDPFAGDGLFLETAANAWKVTPYANELDGERAQACIERFGPTQAIRCDVERLLASSNAFGAAWLNPPYDHDKTAKANKRVEFAYLRHSWKWLQDGGLALWCVYNQHITEDAAAFLAKNSSRVDVWALPGKHQGEYDQVVIVAIKGGHPNPTELYQGILDSKSHPRLLTVQAQPLYKLPAPPQLTRFVFAPDIIDEEQGLLLIQEQGAWKTNGFQALLEVPRPPEQIEPVVAPRPGHMALVLAAGVANGAVIQTEDYGKVAIRGKTQHLEQIARVEIEATPGDPERQIKKTTIRLKPTTTLTLLAQDGTLVEMDGDEALLGFITANKQALTSYLNQKFKPMYRFDLNGMGRWLDRIRLKGKYTMYTAQKHVVAAVTRGFQSRNSILLVGQCGVGKAQSLDSKVLTPTGWKRMGDIQLGDTVINPEGDTAKVIGIFPQGRKDMYRVMFSDGTSTECCQEHLWLVNTPFRKWKGQAPQVKSLGAIMRQGLCDASGNYQHFIPMTHPIDTFSTQMLPIEPYVLGILLGDGSISKNTVGFSSADSEIVLAMRQLVTPSFHLKQLNTYDYAIQCGVRLPSGHLARHPMKEALAALGLMGQRSETKFIPDCYRYASLEARIALMQGLFDADATLANSTGIGIEYTTVSPSLAEHVQELVWSMGGRATMALKQPTYSYGGEKRQGQTAYRLYITLPDGIQPFRLSRKSTLYKPGTKYHPTRAIAKVIPVGKREAQCIALDSTNQLYITDDYLVTHNTVIGGSAAIALSTVESLQSQQRPDQVTLIVAPPHLIEKWKRELHSISRNILVERLDRHEDVKAFMDKAARAGSGIAKIGLIKRDMTKLGAGREVGVVWRDEWVALWRHDATVPEGYEPKQRLVKQRVPKCPTCGCTVMQEKKGVKSPASESWLKGGKRLCSVCQTPLWQESRDKGSQPRPGQKYPTKNPRYRIDEYLKRIYPERVYLLIWDEVHECAHGDTGNGEAFNRIAGLADKVLAMTGTPFNGRSSSIFNLEYALNPRTRQRYNWGGAPRLSRKTRGERGFQIIAADDSKQRGRAESRWVSEMGVREQVVEERPSYDKETGAFTGTSTYERPYEEAPGISPLLVAEVLDHAIFFSLGDLGKALPKYEEIALPVEMDADTYEQYDRTRQQLKDYLIQRRWEGDTTFRGAYLQWAMGWPNAAHRPHEVIHNIKHPITGKKLPYIVTSIPSYGEDRIFAKEQALIELVRSELEQDRPCVIYIRQTSTRDIQPRIERLIRQHVPLANTFILKNTVEAERREAVIEAEVAKGTNVVISNPELVKTGLDLVFAPTLIFYEIVFNLGTMMQAAGRSYRLNQTHQHCKTYYLFCEGTMEQTAVQLMSRKQRAAKLLTGDIGLTGLDALTEGEGGFEEALLNAIGRDETLLDPSELFKRSEAQGDIDTEDAAYWNVELSDAEPLLSEIMQAQRTSELEGDPVVQEAIQLGGVIAETKNGSFARETAKIVIQAAEPQGFGHSISRYLDTVHLIADDRKRAQLQAKLLAILTNGVQADDGTYAVVGLCDPEFTQYPVHTETMIRHIRNWLREHHFVFTGCEQEVAVQIVLLAKQDLGIGRLPGATSNILEMPPVIVGTQSKQAATSQHRNRQPNLLASGKKTKPQSTDLRHEEQDETAPMQLALF